MKLGYFPTSVPPLHNAPFIAPTPAPLTLTSPLSRSRSPSLSRPLARFLSLSLSFFSRATCGGPMSHHSLASALLPPRSLFHARLPLTFAAMQRLTKYEMEQIFVILMFGRLWHVWVGPPAASPLQRAPLPAAPAARASLPHTPKSPCLHLSRHQGPVPAPEMRRCLARSSRALGLASRLSPRLAPPPSSRCCAGVPSGPALQPLSGRGHAGAGQPGLDPRAAQALRRAQVNLAPHPSSLFYPPSSPCAPAQPLLLPCWRLVRGEGVSRAALRQAL